MIRTSKWSWILSFHGNRVTNPFGELPFHWQLSMASNDALAIYYGSWNEKTCCGTSFNVCVDSDDVILQIWMYHSYNVKVVMMTLLTVVLCIVCIIGTSTICAYCIPPHGWWGQLLRCQRDSQNRSTVVYGTGLMRSQTNSFVVCTLWCLTLKPAV